MLEEPVAVIHGRLVDDELEQLLQRAPEIGPGAKADGDEIVAVDGEIAQPVRRRQLLLQERLRRFEAADVAVLRAPVGEPVRDEIEGELVAVREQEAPRLPRRLRPVLVAIRMLAPARDSATDKPL